MDRLPLYIIISANHQDADLVRIGHDKAVHEAEAPLACKMSFADVLRRDYKNETYGFSPRVLSMMAISIDEWELLRTQRLDMTMDTCVGIATHDRSKQYGSVLNCSNHRLLMVEFKLKCKSPNRVKMTDLLGKVRHTHSLFAGHRIDQTNIFIFPDGLVSSYRSTLNRFRNGAGKNDYVFWEIMSPEDFNNYIAFEADLPFQPINKKENIINHIKSACGNNNTQRLEASLNHWRNRMEQYWASYQIQEAAHIKQTLREVIEEILPDLSNDDRQFIEMEYSVFLK